MTTLAIQSLGTPAKQRLRHGLLAAMVVLGFGGQVPAVLAQASPPSPPVPASVTAFPYYHAQHVLNGLYGLHLPPRAEAFRAETKQLSAALASECNAAAAPALQAQWLRVVESWQALATPAIGPVLSRRSQRAINFWPSRPNLLEKALARRPSTLKDLVRIGTPAKGIPALEWLLRRPLTPETCAYAGLLSQDLEAEAAGISIELSKLAASVKEANRESEEEGSILGPMFGEWVNQWLGGWEQLRWAYIEQPLQKARTRQSSPEFARQDAAANLAEWRAQWQALQLQARLAPEQLRAPPQPNEALISIEALLMGKGQMALAGRWAKALDKVQVRMEALAPRAQGFDAKELMALSREMKAVTVLFQNEVAQALDVPLGFSDADGD